MARRFVKASSDYLSRPGAIVPGYPFSFGCWVLGLDSGNVFSLGNTGDDNQYIRATLNVSTGATSFTVAGAGYVNFSSSIPGGYALGTWVHLLWVAASATDRRVHANGALIGSDSASAPWPTGLNVTALGCLRRVGTIEHLGGAIAYAAFWSAALTTREIAALASGCSPPLVRPQAIAEYWPLEGTSRREEPGAVAGRSLAAIGTSWAAEPPGPSGPPPGLHLASASARPATWHDVAPAPRAPAPPSPSARRPARWYPGLSSRRRRA